MHLIEFQWADFKRCSVGRFQAKAERDILARERDRRIAWLQQARSAEKARTVQQVRVSAMPCSIRPTPQELLYRS